MPSSSSPWTRNQTRIRSWTKHHSSHRQLLHHQRLLRLSLQRGEGKRIEPVALGMQTSPRLRSLRPPWLPSWGGREPSSHPLHLLRLRKSRSRCQRLWPSWGVRASSRERQSGLPLSRFRTCWPQSALVPRSIFVSSSLLYNELARAPWHRGTRNLASHASRLARNPAHRTRSSKLALRSPCTDPFLRRRRSIGCTGRGSVSRPSSSPRGPHR